MAIVLGTFVVARVAAAPSPVVVAVPVPATVEMIPEVLTSLIRLFPPSAMNAFPEESKAMSHGVLRVAEVAAAVSPVKLQVPVPAKLEMMPVLTVILRTRQPLGS